MTEARQALEWRLCLLALLSPSREAGKGANLAKEAPPNPPNEREKAPPRPSPSLGKGNRARGESSQALPAAGPVELQDGRLREKGRVVLDAALWPPRCVSRRKNFVGQWKHCRVN